MSRWGKRAYGTQAERQQGCEDHAAQQTEHMYYLGVTGAVLVDNALFGTNEDGGSMMRGGAGVQEGDLHAN